MTIRPGARGLVRPTRTRLTRIADIRRRLARGEITRAAAIDDARRVYPRLTASSVRSLIDTDPED